MNIGSCVLEYKKRWYGRLLATTTDEMHEFPTIAWQLRIAAINSMPKHKLTNLHTFLSNIQGIPFAYAGTYTQMVFICFDNNKLRQKQY